ncbi:Bacterial regulatory protein, tetR family [Candidatus Izimaplasma bacterium HR1]|jgi:AcrR family transcriptional regulator|uniref:TetR/AcrR family transcriptional regulator n=1 Tax=Candidatus Izimoplasma sp. HR1 TaxID=1541959 RepID=UPI0004F8F3A5|nr:Bacterial regulatory protein, tetR family [Candidatus Izimaplasma bacterium HR1]
MFENEKVDMRIKYTREWTFEALHKLLLIKPFNEIKISEIIDKAGISRATFYRNFSSKEDIVIIKVKGMFNDFHKTMLQFYAINQPHDETHLIGEFFKRIDEEEKLVDTVVKSNLEYLMIEGIQNIISYYNDRFYELVKTNKKTEEYTMDIVSSSCWTLLSRWHKTGKEETPTRLAKIYLGAFRSVYIALFEDRNL